MKLVDINYIWQERLCKENKVLSPLVKQLKQPLGFEPCHRTRNVWWWRLWWSKDSDRQWPDGNNLGSSARPLCPNSWSPCLWREGYSFFLVGEPSYLTSALRSPLGEKGLGKVRATLYLLFFSFSFRLNIQYAKVSQLRVPCSESHQETKTKNNQSNQQYYTYLFFFLTIFWHSFTVFPFDFKVYRWYPMSRTWLLV